MIGTSLPEYVFIRTSIALLRLVAPLSFIYVAYLLAARPVAASRWQYFLGWYTVMEVLFYILVYLPRRHLLQKACIYFSSSWERCLTRVTPLACGASPYSYSRTPAYTISTVFQPFGNIRLCFWMVPLG